MNSICFSRCVQTKKVCFAVFQVILKTKAVGFQNLWDFSRKTRNLGKTQNSGKSWISGRLFDGNIWRQMKEPIMERCHLLALNVSRHSHRVKVWIWMKGSTLERRPFVCYICDKAFSTSSNLKTGKRIHTAVQPSACSKSEKAFKES